MVIITVLSTTPLSGHGSDVAGFLAKYHNNKRTRKKKKTRKKSNCVTEKAWESSAQG